MHFAYCEYMPGAEAQSICMYTDANELIKDDVGALPENVWPEDVLDAWLGENGHGRDVTAKTSMPRYNVLIERLSIERGIRAWALV